MSQVLGGGQSVAATQAQVRSLSQPAGTGSQAGFSCVSVMITQIWVAGSHSSPCWPQGVLPVDEGLQPEPSHCPSHSHWLLLRLSQLRRPGGQDWQNPVSAQNCDWPQVLAAAGLQLPATHWVPLQTVAHSHWLLLSVR